MGDVTGSSLLDLALMSGLHRYLSSKDVLLLARTCKLPYLNHFISTTFTFQYSIFKYYSPRKLVKVYYPSDQPYFPPMISQITFTYGFNSPVDHLPSSLTHITFSGYFNQPINSLPPNLTHLIFKETCNFNHPITSLPSSLTHLIFRDQSRFNQPIDSLPSNLSVLYFGFMAQFNQKIFSLPPQLSHFLYGKSSLLVNTTDYKCKSIITPSLDNPLTLDDLCTEKGSYQNLHYFLSWKLFQIPASINKRSLLPLISRN